MWLLSFVCRNKSKHPFFFLFCSSIFCSLSLFGQVTTSSLVGFVFVKPNDAGVDATITLTQTETLARFQTKTAEDGRYRFSFLDPGGPYIIEILLGDTVSYITKPIFLAVSDVRKKNIFVWQLQRTGMVRELDELILSSLSQRSGLLKDPNISFDDTQLKTYSSIDRSITDYTQLSSYASASGTGFAGKDGRYNNFTLDGASLNNSFGLSNQLPGGDAQPISLDVVGQLNVLITPFDIRQSGFTSGSVNLVTKRGKNQFHGGAYYFYRDKIFVGDKVEEQGVNNPNNTYATFGATVGGPIVKNKLFFFINAEYENKIFPAVNVIPSVGTTDLSTPTNNISRTTTEDLDKISNFLKTTYGYETGGYDIGAFPSRNYKLFARLDWKINNQHNLMIRYSYMSSKNLVGLEGYWAPLFYTVRSARISKNAYSYVNSLFSQTNIVQSFVLDLKSNFSFSVSNQLLITWSTDYQKRSTSSSIFPFIDIEKGGDHYLSVGYEPLTYRTGYSNPTFSIVDNVVITSDKHLITLGASFETFDIDNIFMPFGNSYYRYSSVDDFINVKDPVAFGLSYAYEERDPATKINYAQLATYVQDEIMFSPAFSLSVGLRFDVPMYLNTLAESPQVKALKFQDLSDKSISLDISKWPSASVLLSPRVSFRWDPTKLNRLSIKGGLGIFTGKIPFVWFAGQPSNAGLLFNTVQYGGSEAASFVFKPTIDAYVNQLPSQPTGIPRSIVLISQDFKMPQIARLYLSADYDLGKNFHISLEALYTKDINAVNVYNANLKKSNTTILGRESWWNADSLQQSNKLYTTSQSTSIHSNVNEAIIMTNTDKGNGLSLTARLSKSIKVQKNRVQHQFFADFAYTFTTYQDVTDMTNASLPSAYKNKASIGSLNNTLLGNSLYALPHRVVLYLNYKLSYAAHLATSLSLTYVGTSYGRYDYTYANDINGDGRSKDLLYVPSSREDIEFATQSDENQFWTFLEQDEVLKNNKGKTLQRGAGLLPWHHLIHFRLLQDLVLNPKGKTQHTLQFSFEVNNLLNLINSSWGIAWASTNNARTPLKSTGTVNSISKQPIFEYSGSDNQTSFTPLISTASTWSMNLGVRYIF